MGKPAEQFEIVSFSYWVNSLAYMMVLNQSMSETEEDAFEIHVYTIVYVYIIIVIKGKLFSLLI